MFRNALLPISVRVEGREMSVSAAAPQYALPGMTVTPSGTVIERGDYMEPLWRVSGETEWRHFANAGNPFDAIEGQLPLDIRDYAELSFDKASKKFTLGSFIGTRWTVYSPTNSVVGSGTTTAVETELPLTDVASGTYRVRLVYGGADFFINITL